MLSRPQKILRAGSIEELGRTILYPLYPDNIFSTNVLEEIHQMYCSKDITYAISKMLKEQLFHKNMKAKLSIYNKTCLMSCIYHSLSMEERYRMYNPHGLGGSLQFKAMQDISSRMNSVICNLMGLYFTKCRVWIAKEKFGSFYYSTQLHNFYQLKYSQISLWQK